MYRLADHTADLAIEAEGDDRGEALSEAALALTCILTGRDAPHKLGNPDREAEFVVEAPDLDALAVAFLAELLWLHESEDLLWVGGGVQVEEAGELVRARAAGNVLRHAPHQHGRGVEVKAVTYHGLRFVREGSQWRLWVLLDI